MNLTAPVSFLLYVGHLLLLPPLLIGFIRTGKARLQNRQGPSIWQPFWDTLKLFRKGETVSATTTWMFRAAPAIGLSIIAAAGLLVPLLGVPSPISGHLVLLAY